MAVRSLKNSTLENFANYSSSMNAGYSFQDYELIESVFVASPAASVTFNNLDQYATDYKHLQIRFVGRSLSGGADDSMRIRFNGDSSSIYTLHQLIGLGSSVISTNATGQNASNIGIIAGGTAVANSFGLGIIDIIDCYSIIKNKTLRALTGLPDGSSLISLRSALYANTASISSIALLTSSAANFATGSRFSLYGIR